MAEPQPPPIVEGMEEVAPPATAEDRKTAAAMNALESRGADAEEEESGQKPTKQIDSEALSKAISRLEIADKGGKAATPSGPVNPKEVEWKRKREEELKEKERRSKIKLDQSEVSILVEELDLTKTKAMELLRAHEGNFRTALTAFLRSGVV